MKLGVIYTESGAETIYSVNTLGLWGGWRLREKISFDVRRPCGTDIDKYRKAKCKIIIPQVLL